MKKVKIKFIGKTTDEHGMPEPYNNYYVISVPGEQDGYATSSALPLSQGAIIPNPPHRFVKSGGVKQAYMEILEALRQLPSNKNLEEIITKE